MRCREEYIVLKHLLRTHAALIRLALGSQINCLAFRCLGMVGLPEGSVAVREGRQMAACYTLLQEYQAGHLCALTVHWQK